MARTHRMTPKRKAALRKAQKASARKRRGKGNGKLAAAHRRARRNARIAVGINAGLAGVAMAAVGSAYYTRKVASGGPPSKKISYE